MLVPHDIFYRQYDRFSGAEDGSPPNGGGISVCGVGYAGRVTKLAGDRVPLSVRFENHRPVGWS
ncbi:hypothetical protein KCP70_18345 [Salmonella enterica subsp. enterica]|nr:hypothetical protein KCP70_18345 [Salmonella enterica subsp. enterica]